VGETGLFLWQFPPNFPFEVTLLERFLALLPRTIGEAVALASQHDARVKQPWFDAKRDGRLRHAVEVRHARFCSAECIDVLRDHVVALVVSDSVAGWPYAEDVTANFFCMRLRGTQTPYGGAYSEPALERWSKRTRPGRRREPSDAIRLSPVPARLEPRDVYCYFDNDQKVPASFDAQRFKRWIAEKGKTGASR
jgi:uncharacterized protein YecE (DUF72 family)